MMASLVAFGSWMGTAEVRTAYPEEGAQNQATYRMVPLVSREARAPPPPRIAAPAGPLRTASRCFQFRRPASGRAASNPPRRPQGLSSAREQAGQRAVEGAVGLACGAESAVRDFNGAVREVKGQAASFNAQMARMPALAEESSHRLSDVVNGANLQLTKACEDAGKTAEMLQVRMTTSVNELKRTAPVAIQDGQQSIESHRVQQASNWLQAWQRVISQSRGERFASSVQSWLAANLSVTAFPAMQPAGSSGLGSCHPGH